MACAEYREAGRLIKGPPLGLNTRGKGPSESGQGGSGIIKRRLGQGSEMASARPRGYCSRMLTSERSFDLLSRL